MPGTEAELRRECSLLGNHGIDDPLLQIRVNTLPEDTALDRLLRPTSFQELSPIDGCTRRDNDTRLLLEGSSTYLLDTKSPPSISREECLQLFVIAEVDEHEPVQSG